MQTSAVDTTSFDVEAGSGALRSDWPRELGRISGNGQHDGIPAEEVRAELQRILDSADFTASARNRRALQLIVEHSLSEPAAKVPARVLATGIYGRGPDFSSLKDPIVRVEMLRLRKDLSGYYSGAGAANPLRIRIPKGSYRAAFRRAEEAVQDGAAGFRCNEDFVSGVLHAALAGLAGRREEAAAAFHNLLRMQPDLIGHLQERVSSRFRDERVVRLLVEGLSRAAGISA